MVSKGRGSAISNSTAPGLGPWRKGEDPTFTAFPDDALDRSIAERFIEVATANPESVALRSPAGAWTYRELLDQATTLAHGIAASVGTDHVPVAVIADHDGPLVVAILAILMAGCVVLVVDPLAPDDQRDHVIAETQPALLLHDESHADAAAAMAARAEVAPALASIDGLTGPEVDLPTTGPHDPVMLAFTSGTSGLPKAGTITNSVLVNLIRGATNALGITAADRMPMLFPTSLAVAAYPLFLPLLNGGTLATLDVRSVGLAPVGRFLTEERITLAYMAPTVVRFLVDSLRDLDFPDLRMIALGGEVVDAEVVRLTQEVLGPDRIANGFGTTETGVITLYVIEPGEVLDGPVPAGHPVDEVELLVLDDHGDPVPAGVAGEVAIVSPHVFAGYWGHRELTDTVLQADPSGRDGWSLYRTGDLGRVEDTGALTVLGRLDTKVKVRGRFVVLGDVESAVQGLDDVADATVVAHVADGITQLHAHVVLTAESAASAASLRAELLDRHEAYEVPSLWQVVEELPRLPNGKVDRQTIADQAGRTTPETALGGGATPIRSTTYGSDERAQLHRSLRDLWEGLLPQDIIGLDDDFFELGGDSLLAAQMLVLTEHQLDTIVPMSALVDATTIRSLTEVIVDLRARTHERTSTVARVQAGDPTRPRLWFVHDLPGSAFRVRFVAEHLGADQPVWSFESPFLRGESNPYRTLGEFAANYVSDLREAQPEGPYWLAGHSFGGICAYEMARQLRADGCEVAFVGVIDVGPGYRGPNWTGRHSPPWPYFGVPTPPPGGARPTEVAMHYTDMVKRNPRAAARHLSIRTGAARHVDGRRFTNDLRRFGRVRPDWRLWYAWEEHWKLATKSWDRTSTYDDTMDLLWASQTGSADGSMGWSDLVQDLRIHRFEGSHDDLLEEAGAPALAASLRSAIDERLANPPNPETS